MCLAQQRFDEIYLTVVRRESTYDGIYYTGVKTTKIVCRPSCKAKTPKPENVSFYPSLEEALKHGYRPCKRCKPDENGKDRPDAALASRVNEIIERRYDRKVTLAGLAGELAVSPYHLQRVYKSVTGLSPNEKWQQVRLEQATRQLADTHRSVSEIGKEVGFANPSHFADWFHRMKGQTPSEYRSAEQGGASRDDE